jgi:hypothetical protein
MKIGKFGLTIGKSHHPDKPLLKIINVKYFATTGRELVIHCLGIFINISWLGQIYKLSTDL